MAGVNDSRIVSIADLKQFEDVLTGNFHSSTSIVETPIYWIHGSEDAFIFDDTIPEYPKVPELAGTRFLMDMEVLEAMANRYIPIYDKKTKKSLFSKEKFLELRKKMSGLKEYQAGDFLFSSHLEFPGMEKYLVQIENNFQAINEQKIKINRVLSSILEQLGIKVSAEPGIGNADLIDTGSTSRGTNIPGNQNWDFDFIMRVDTSQLDIVRETLIRNLMLGGLSNSMLSRRRIRLKDIHIPGIEKPMDIDISFVPNDKKYFSTDASLVTRLEQIKQQDETKYKLVLANIMHAKDLLKKANAYKPSRSDSSQAGLGGVGIENWILQYGGSLEDASRDFLAYAEGRNFMEFEKVYSVFDFGRNHISVARNTFPFDNFVMKNMRENGYEKTKQALHDWMLTIAPEEYESAKAM